jgi:cell division protein FtsB
MSLRQRRRAWWIFLGAAALLAGAAAADPRGLRQHVALAAQARTLADENLLVETEIARLALEVRALRSDRAALERAAREELRFVRPGEIIYRLDASPGGTP